MKAPLDVQSLEDAREVFRGLGAALSEFLIFGEAHPRFQSVIDRLLAILESYAKKNAGSGALTYTLEGDQVEFRRVPLLDLGAQADRLVRILGAGGFAGLQLRLPISRESLKRLLEKLQERSRGASPGDPAPEAGVEGDGFRVLVRKEVEGLLQGLYQEACAEGGAPCESGYPELPVTPDNCRSVLASCRSLLANQERGLCLTYEQMESTADQVVSLIGADAEFQESVQSKSYFDEFSFHHSVNVCFLATRLASTFVKDQRQLRRISMAALLHDVGKSGVPAEIIYKPGKLSPEEFETIKLHPVIGAEILLGVKGIDPLCVDVAFGHHMSSAPTSYPATRKPFPCDWINQLISVVDIYEALTAIRPYKNALSPESAFRVLFSMPGLKDRMSLVKLLYECLGPYPVGAFVELTTGERAVVVEQNTNFPYRPRVRVLTDRSMNRLPEPLDLDLAAAQGPDTPKIKRTIVLQTPRSDPLQGEPDSEPTDILGAPLTDDTTLMEREA